MNVDTDIDFIVTSFRQPLSINTIGLLVGLVIRRVEQMYQVSGAEKKAIALQIIRAAVKRIPMDDGVRTALETTIELTAPGLIDSLVALDVEKAVKRCCSCLFG